MSTISAYLLGHNQAVHNYHQWEHNPWASWDEIPEPDLSEIKPLMISDNIEGFRKSLNLFLKGYICTFSALCRGEKL